MKKSPFQSKKVLLVAAALIGLFSCARKDPGQPQIVLMKSSYGQSLMFGGAKSVIGLDPLTDRQTIDIRFSHFVLLGDITSDGRLLCADIGKGVGDFGGRVLMLDAKGKLVGQAPTLPNPGKVRLVGNYVFCDSVGYYDEGYTAYMLSDAKTLEKVHEDRTLPHFVSNDRSWIYGNHAYIGVKPNEAFEGRRSEIRRLDLESLTSRSLTSFTDRHPYYYFNCAVTGKYLVIAYIQAAEIEVFDLDTGRSVAFIRLSEYVPQLKNDPHAVISGKTIDSSYRLERPIEENGKMYFHLMPNAPDAFYQALVRLDTGSWTLEKIVPLEQNYILSAIDLSHVRNGKAYYCDHQDIYIYDAEDGSFLKEISIGK